MNILITGSNGFIGRNLSKQLEQRYNYSVTTLNRNNCDLLDSKFVYDFFLKQNTTYDLVLHTAIEGGRRNKIDSESSVYRNILMLYNLLINEQYFKHMISFGSGAELDRRNNVNNSSNITHRYPIDPYGMSKHIINNIIINESKLSNFRIYNCFGIDEQPDRMIRSNITRYLNKQDMIIYQDRIMDFFYIDDLASTIHYFIQQNSIPKHFECCYKEKYSLYDITNIINELDTHKVKISIESTTRGNDYYGLYKKLPIDYIGLKNAISIIYNNYLGSNNI